MVKDIETLKGRLKNNQAVLGAWNSISSPALVNVIGAGGMDFIIIDMEHGPAGMETAEDLVRAAEVAGMTPLIRVSVNRADLILRALDIGARGIQVPHVSTGAEAQQVVEYAKYYPDGTRGLSPFTRAGGYGLDAKGYTERANQETIVVVKR